MIRQTLIPDMTVDSLVLSQLLRCYACPMFGRRVIRFLGNVEQPRQLTSEQTNLAFLDGEVLVKRLAIQRVE